jgi:glycosyltransferase involved in cell wall biosynthesis
MPPNNPLVSIVIPVYNGARYLKEAIDSALAQTYSPCEIIVVNDGSKDDGKTEAAALSYGNRIQYVSKPNGGVASALNCGIRKMKGEYFSWLSHDDVYCPEKIKAQVKLLSSLPDGTIAFSDYRHINEHSQKLDTIKHGRVSKIRLQELLIADASIQGCTLLIPSLCFSRAGCFDETMKTTQDYRLWYVFSGVFSFVHLPRVTVLSRIHSEQGTRTMSDIAKKETHEYRVWAISRCAEKYDRKRVMFCLARIAVRLKINGCGDESRFAASVCRDHLRAEGLLMHPWALLQLLYFYLSPKRLMIGYGALATHYLFMTIGQKLPTLLRQEKAGRGHFILMRHTHDDKVR